MFNAKALLDAIVSAGSQAGQGAPQAGQGAPRSGQGGGLSGGLGGLADQFQKAGGVGGLAGMAGQIFGQATQGVGDAARNTGLTTRAPQAGTGQTAPQQAGGGRTPQDILAQARDMATRNPGKTAVALGGLGALVFGTKTGRKLAGSAVKMGGLALIGGLAYKAYQNHQAGKPLLDMPQQEVLLAPAGTGFEPEAASDETALVLIRAMIAAAAADGHIDDQERAAITGGLREAGLDAEANEWLEQELANPAKVEQLVAAANTPVIAAEIYTAARIAINPDNPAEKDFLAGLAGALNLEAELVANIDAAAGAAKV